MTIFAVIAETAGAHESPDVMSLWSSRELAEKEIQRLELPDTKPTTMYDGGFEIVEVLLDGERNEWIG